MTSTQAPAPPKKRNTKLVREVGIIGLTWASMGSIIGSGWLFGPQEALIAAGPAAIISWVIGGVAIVVLALVHAELGGMYPVSGGTARFPHYAFGGVAGASFGWFAWLNAATVAPIEVSAMLTYAGHYDFANGWINPDNGVLSFTGIVVAIILMAILTAINFLGVKKLAATNSAATWWKIAIPLLTILVLAIANFDTSNLTAANGFNPAGLKGIFAAVSTGGIIFSYLGFEQADQLAGESANPKRDVPFAIIGSVVFGTILYILLQLVFLFALPKSAIGDTWDQVGNGLYTTFTGPFAEIASLLSIGWLAAIIYADAIISPGGTGLIYTTGSSRLAYGLSRNGYVPSAFEWTNKRNVPWVGLLAAFITGCICFLPFPSWQSLVGLITSASVLMYGGAPLSLGAFRRRLPDAERPYRLPAAGFLSPVAFIIANLIILWTGWDTIWKLGITILIGYAILVANRVFKLNEHKPTLDWKAASWLIPYLIGMGVIVYISDFGPKGDNALIPFGWDALVVAAWSLVVYYWAMAVALSTEQIEEMIGEVEEPEEGMAPVAH
ncbi:APC family permease [Nocardioides sp. LS1]|uniref:APC family permease n=1 Tax=Nocardioides sp. LS1 TaxID=1027620 RepID=UPI000F62441A|nr:APC family permease [Nocardioides sp. LS1]GCD91994.1 amino acid permease [Nocardioides sp. LS1]